MTVASVVSDKFHDGYDDFFGAFILLARLFFLKFFHARLIRTL
jgi:hypothetical protein